MSFQVWFLYVIIGINSASIYLLNETVEENKAQIALLKESLGNTNDALLVHMKEKQEEGK